MCGTTHSLGVSCMSVDLGFVSKQQITGGFDHGYTTWDCFRFLLHFSSGVTYWGNARSVNSCFSVLCLFRDVSVTYMCIPLCVNIDSRRSPWSSYHTSL